MTKNVNLREAITLIGQAVFENWQGSNLDAPPLPTPEAVEAAIAQLRAYANKQASSLQSLLTFKKPQKRHVKGVHRPTLSQHLDVLKFPALLDHDFSKGVPATYTAAYQAYASQQHALSYLKELLRSEKLEANYTKTANAETLSLPASLVSTNLVEFDLRKNRVKLLGEIEGALSIPLDKLTKLLRSKSVIESLHAPTALPSITPPVSFAKDNKKLLTPEQAAEKLGYSVKTLAEWRYRGNSSLKYITLENKRIRYHPDDVDAFIEAQEKT